MEITSANPELRKPLAAGLRFLLAGLLVAAIAWSIPLGAVWAALRTAHPLPLCAALVTLVGARLLGCVRTKVLTDGQGLTLSIRRLFEITCASTLYGLALPGTFTGGVVRWYQISQPGGNRSQALVVVTVERAVDLFVLALLGLLCWIGDASPGRNAAVCWCLAAIAAVCLPLTMGVLSPLGGSTSQALQGIIRHLNWLPRRIHQGLTRLAVAFGGYRSLRAATVLELFGVSLAIHVVLTLSQYLMSHSLELGLSLLSVAWVRAAVILLTSLPITPSGLGVRELSLVFLLLPLGVSSPEAVAFSVLQLAGVLFIALFGLHFSIRRSRRPTPTAAPA